MVLALIISGAAISASIFGLYTDYEMRKEFDKKFFPTKRIDENQLFTGIISSDNSCLVAYKLDKYVKKKKIRNFYRPIKDNFVSIPNCHVAGRSYAAILPIEPLDSWEHNNVITYLSSSLKFNNFDLLINNKTIINYLNNKVYYSWNKEMFVENYIPNNSEITIFGKKINDNTYDALFIGKEKDVLNSVAKKYFGINDTKTFFLVFVLVISGTIFINSQRSCSSR